MRSVGRGCHLLENESTISLANTAFSPHAVEQLIEILGAGDSGPNTEVERTGEMEALNDPVVVCDQGTKVVTIPAVDKPHIDRRLNGPTQHGVIDLGFETDNDLAIDQPLEPSTRRVGAEPHFPAQLSLSYSTPPLNNAEYFSVQIINHSVYHCNCGDCGPKPVPNAAQCGSWC